MVRPRDALAYHREGRPGKLEIRPTKPSHTQLDLALAYSPGVAEPCLEIHKNPEDSFLYTARGNLVAVISNGTAVLGLGDIGPLASKPVMEGKAILFKRFADIDVFDLELATKDIDDFCLAVKLLEPTFGGINLEDVKAPECFEIEQRLAAEMDIPVFHDDQHGTAIISSAAFLNWLFLTDRQAGDVRIVISGAGASGIQCANMLVRVGARPENVLMLDSHGVLTLDRQDSLNEYKRPFARETAARTLAEALEGAHVFLGLSVANVLSGEMVRRMADRPLIMALANPNPEIPYPVAKEARPDAIVCTGRSDFPNQVNNVLGFPFIFRGALDVRARKINIEMKLAAVQALAELAREPVPAVVSRAYGGRQFEFGPEYVIPTPMDVRVLTRVAPAVAKAAVDSGVARAPITDWLEYVHRLEERLGNYTEVLRFATHRARQAPPRIVFPEGEEERVLTTAAHLKEERIAEPVLIGRIEPLRRAIRDLELLPQLEGVEIHDPESSPHYAEYWREYWRMRERRGVSRFLAKQQMTQRFPFASMMLHQGHVQGMVAGLGGSFPEMLGPLYRIVQCRDQAKAPGVHLVIHRNELYFFVDTSAVVDPSVEDLAHFTCATAEFARRFNVEPRVAMLSFSNFGSVRHPEAEKMRRAAELVRERMPDLVVEGEMQADTALMPDFAKEHFPFAKLDGKANVLVFPNLAAGNISYKIAQLLGASMTIGPFIVGLERPVALLSRYVGVTEVYQSAVVTAMLAVGEARPEAVLEAVAAR